MEYQPVIPTTRSTRVTRQTKVWYNLSTGCCSQPDTSLLLPATIYQDPLYADHLFYATNSPNIIPTASPPAASPLVWDLDDSLHILADTPEFYQ